MPAGKIIYSSPMVPAEWIAAHGFDPSRRVPASRAGRRFPGTRVCPFMWHFLREASSAAACAGIVLATSCDQMRRAAEYVWPARPARSRAGNRPVCLFNVPATYGTAASRELFAMELDRLGDFLVDLGGRRPSQSMLARAMNEYDRARAELRSVRSRLSPRTYAEAIGVFVESGRLDLRPGMVQPGPGTTRIAVVGGPLFREDVEIFSIIENCGGYVALDGTENGGRSLPAAFSRRGIEADPVAELTRAYADSIPDAFRRPNTLLYRWLEDGLRDAKPDGIVVCRHLWCDIWHAEVETIRKRSRIPVIDLELENQPVSRRDRTRLEAFVESLARAGRRTGRGGVGR